MAKIKTNQVLLTIEGKPFTEEVEVDGVKTKKDITLGKQVGKIIAAAKSDDPIKSFRLAEQFYTQEEVELQSEDVVFIKNILKQSDYVAQVIGQIFIALEGGAPAKKEGDK